MKFAYEYQMLKPAERWLKAQGLETKREFPTPWGICDLVGCSFNRESVKTRLELGQRKPVGPQLRVALLLQVPDHETGKSISVQTLSRRFGEFIDESRIALEMDKLEKDRFVQRRSRGGYQRLNGWMPLHKRLIAVELKLSRITEALHQARNNLEFADESYVGLPAKIADRLIESEKKSEFQRQGIGVLAIDHTGCRVVLEYRPAKSVTNGALQMHCSERFWRTRLKDTAT